MSNPPDHSTIFALSTAPGRAGVALVRVSGPRAGTVLNLMARPRPKPRVAGARVIIHPVDSRPLDRGIVLWFPGPRSFTGEDVAEFMLHGGRAVVAAVLAALGEIKGCRLAEPGEFARRAFDNGKLDLAEAEGLADLIDAETEAQRRQALQQAMGGLSSLVEGWREMLIDAASLVEASIDFSDESDVSEGSFAQGRAIVAGLEAVIRHHLQDANRGEILRDGFRVALAGPPNAGKSSLLNVLARRPAAIVSEEAGTTRDVIDVRLDLGGYPVILSDTAGIRQTEMRVEKEGIRRSLETARAADLILWLIDPAAPEIQLPEELRPLADRVLLVRNKADLLPTGVPPALPDDSVLISAKTGQGIDELTDRLAAIARDRLDDRGQPAALTTARHRALVTDAHHHLCVFLESTPHDTELRAEDLRRAGHALGRLTGRIDVEDVLDRIFGRFCIGK
jgi:tRNA modification GTPase